MFFVIVVRWRMVYTMRHSSSERHRLTSLLIAWRDGDPSALDALMPLVYEELHRVAHRQMRRERQEHTLQTSALVNEAYLRLIDQDRTNWQNREQFFGVAAQLMRRILVDHARSRRRSKRGGGAVRVSLSGAAPAAERQAEDVLALHEALEQLEVIDQRKARVVELRFFGGLSIAETAEVLQLAPATIMKDWTLGKAFLHRAIGK